VVKVSFWLRILVSIIQAKLLLKRETTIYLCKDGAGIHILEHRLINETPDRLINVAMDVWYSIKDDILCNLLNKMTKRVKIELVYKY
jgi:hypothetical protein